MDNPNAKVELERIRRSLRRGAIQRNVKTGAIVAAAASGALISTTALFVTAGTTLAALYIVSIRGREK